MCVGGTRNAWGASENAILQKIFWTPSTRASGLVSVLWRSARKTEQQHPWGLWIFCCRLAWDVAVKKEHSLRKLGPYILRALIIKWKIEDFWVIFKVLRSLKCPFPYKWQMLNQTGCVFPRWPKPFGLCACHSWSTWWAQRRIKLSSANWQLSGHGLH